MATYDVTVIGGGIVGLASMYRLLERFPEICGVILEKECELAHHQTGHNSGVLHSGIYYRPGSLKAQNCRLGKLAMQQFCEQHGVPFDICGKVIVATDASQLTALQQIFVRGQQNGVQCAIIDAGRLIELEPHATGVQAIHVPESGIVDYRAVCAKLGELLVERGCKIITSARVTRIETKRQPIVVEWPSGELQTRFLVNCSGLHSDRIARLTGQPTSAKIVPFRGEYYQLKPEAFHLCRSLIYPVPDPKFPFLGVHFTRMIDGSVECGPNAVLAWSREGYRKWDVNLRDLFESLTYGGFLRLASRHWRMGAEEMWRSFSKRAFVAALQRLVPEICSDLIDAAPSGVRAQAVSPDGKLVDDFLIVDTDRIVNVCNAPSPAATSALNIGSVIVDRLAARPGFVDRSPRAL